jgi:hypothetical protein
MEVQGSRFRVQIYINDRKEELGKRKEEIDKLSILFFLSLALCFVVFLNIGCIRLKP